VAAMSNEWAAAGEEVTIMGDYFLTYDNFPLTVNFGKNYTLAPANILGISKNNIAVKLNRVKEKLKKMSNS
jgi:hypothetical protein